MIRSMYAGVSGLRAHQTRMDTIGNNIANVNTYGFKSGRTTFRDIYYQTVKTASAPTAALGGMNPSSVGYGSQVGGVELLMGRSTFTMTEQTMDVAIDGEGFIQVEDASGNKYFTRSGVLSFDAAGNLVDMQGNYVLGINGDPTGRLPGSERISVTLPAVSPTPASVEQELNGLMWKISATNPTIDGNLNINFSTNPTLPDGQLSASISATGIVISMHPDTSFATLRDLNEQINIAITAANDNEPHPAGDINISYIGDPALDPFIEGPILAEDFVSTDFSIQLGTLKYNDTSKTGGVGPNGKTGSAFGNTWPTTEEAFGNLNITYVPAVAANPAATPPVLAAQAKYTFSQTIGGVTYAGEIDADKLSSGTFIMKNTAATADPNDYFVMSRPSFSDLDASLRAANGDPAAGTAYTIPAVTPAQLNSATGAADTLLATASQPSKALGFRGSSFAMKGGTAGGPQSIEDMTGIYIAPNGLITGLDSVGAEIIIGRIDLATFANPGGLNQAGSSNYTESANSGAPQFAQPGMNGSGKLVSTSLELSNVDLSREFSDMITTQRGYQANSRVITVSDTLLEELINLKR